MIGRLYVAKCCIIMAFHMNITSAICKNPRLLPPRCKTVCIFGNGSRRKHCPMPCNCAQDGPCHPETGLCESGYCHHTLLIARDGNACSKMCPKGFALMSPALVEKSRLLVTRNMTEMCSKQCHCPSVEDCSTIDARCIGGKCDAGYRDFDCQQECGNQTFGLKCVYMCHCMNGVQCHHLTGACLTGCASGYMGKSCQKEKSRHPLRVSTWGPLLLSIVLAALILVCIFVYRKGKERENFLMMQKKSITESRRQSSIMAVDTLDNISGLEHDVEHTESEIDVLRSSVWKMSMKNPITCSSDERYSKWRKASNDVKGRASNTNIKGSVENSEHYETRGKLSVIMSPSEAWKSIRNMLKIRNIFKHRRSTKLERQTSQRSLQKNVSESQVYQRERDDLVDERSNRIVYAENNTASLLSLTKRIKNNQMSSRIKDPEKISRKQNKRKLHDMANNEAQSNIVSNVSESKHRNICGSDDDVNDQFEKRKKSRRRRRISDSIMKYRIDEDESNMSRQFAEVDGRSNDFDSDVEPRGTSRKRYYQRRHTAPEKIRVSRATRRRLRTGSLQASSNFKPDDIINRKHDQTSSKWSTISSKIGEVPKRKKRRRSSKKHRDELADAELTRFGRYKRGSVPSFDSGKT